ncbi:ribosome biogenesis GTPase Der, partial [Patescibacteria group bacterium]|nr:ribosome biogenesis GTPase Der [Patescibacteria group bacterium]
MKTPIITIVGRPNVGKSTLFNKIAGSRIAITAEESGTTRDRLFHKVEHPQIDFFLVDTGGLEFGKEDNTIESDMQLQARVAIEESDLILLMVDSKSLLTGDDYKAAELLRKKSGGKPVFLILSKCDRHMEEVELAELYSLGLGEPHQISALHRTGIDSLLSDIVKELRSMHFITKDDPLQKIEDKLSKKHRNIAMVGRPNVGKSSLINALLNKEKLIVSHIPGTTRDSTDSLIKHKSKEYNFIDTAGLKRPGKTQMGIEKFSALRSMASIEKCDIALLVIDSSEAISHQDQQIASYILDAGKGLIILANKWDIPLSKIDRKGEAKNAEEKAKNSYLGHLKRKF